MRETIQLEEGDSVAVVRYKLEQLPSRRAALVAPPGCRLLASRVDLILIGRLAEELGLDLVLVTGDRAGAELARSVGLRTVASADDARSALVRRTPRPTARLLAEAFSARATGLAERASRRGLQLPAALGSRPQPMAVFSMASAAVLVLLAVLALLPSATVSLDPIGQRASAETELTASVGVERADPEQKVVPARQAQIEIVGEESGQATGKESLPDQHASGEVVFANKTTDQVVVPKGTVVRTNDGMPVKFYTLLDATLAGSYGATARVPVMAFEPGPAGNVEALTIRVVEGEPSYKVDVLNDKAVQGGNDKRVSIVSSQDYDRLRASLMQRLQQEAYDTLVKQLNTGEWIPPDSLEVAIAEETFDKRVDEPAETLRLTMKVQVTGVAVDGAAVRDLMARLLEASGEGLVVNSATLQVAQPVGTATVDGQTIRFRGRAEAMLVPAIDLRTVSAQLAGQTLQNARQRLAAQYSLRQPPEVHIRPGWWPWLPWVRSRIRVQLGGGL